MPSRGMGAVAPSKMPKPVTKKRRDDTDFQEFKKGGKVGLYANINAKRARGEKMRKPGDPGAPPNKTLLIRQKQQRLRNEYF